MIYQKTKTGTVLVSFGIGQGAIEPAIRVANGEISEDVISDLTSRLLASEFYDTIDESKVPTKCVDGRSRKDGIQELGANAAAGTFSLVMGDALTSGSYRKAGEKAKQHALRLFNELIKLGQQVGGHDDDNAQEMNCGCGAEDKLDTTDMSGSSILGYISRHSSNIRQFLDSLGIEVSTELNNAIAQKAEGLHKAEYATNGKDLRQVYAVSAGESSIETLTGQHKEVALVINCRPGTTLNRQKVRAIFGETYQVFNLDVPSLQKACELISISIDEAHDKFVAALYYNVATAAVLAGSSLRVVVRDFVTSTSEQFAVSR